jgi:FkbM family methyltransferase
LKNDLAINKDFESLLQIPENIGLDGNDKRVCEFLKSSKLPVIIYGAGYVGQGVAEVLEKNGISFEFAVDSEFSHDSSVLTPEKADEKYAAYNLIRGMGYAPINRISTFHNAKNIFAILNFTNVEILSREFFCENLPLFEETYNLLEDEKSKRSLIEYIRTELNADVEGLMKFVVQPQYFRDEIYSLPDGYVFVDCGAYNGDTLTGLLRHYPNYGKIVCFEPSASNFEQLEKLVTDKGYKNIELIKKGCSDKNGVLRFCETENQMNNSISDQGNTQIEIAKIDDYLSDEKVSVIKMDIEGAELDALHGAQNTIVKNKPVCMISIYHKRDDLITIPQYLKKLVPEYKFYLRLHQGIWDMVLYAVPDEYQL